MEIHPTVFIGAVIIPLLIIGGIIVWTFQVRKRSERNKKELAGEKSKLHQTEKENKLWEKLLSYKEKHIDLLQKKLKED